MVAQPASRRAGFSCNRPKSAALEAAILVRLQDDPGATVPLHMAVLLADVLLEAEANGARVLGRRDGTAIGPLLVAGATARMRVAQEDLFAPVAALIVVNGIEAALAIR